MGRSVVWVAGLLVVGLGWGSVVRGEVPDASREQLEKRASHIVTGKLRTLFRSTERGKQYEETQGLAEVVVERVEKGEGVRPGQVVLARYWTRKWIGAGDPPPGSSGHRNPPVGTAVRAYLEQDEDGTFKVILPNGMMPLKP